MDILKEEQLEAEKSALGEATDKFKSEVAQAKQAGRYTETFGGNIILKAFFVPVRDKIQEYFDTSYKGAHVKNQNFIKLLSDDANEIAYILITTLISDIIRSGNLLMVGIATKNIIRKLKNLHYFDRLKVDNPKLQAYLGDAYRKASAKRKAALMRHHIKGLYEIEGETNRDDVKYGGILLELFVSSMEDVSFITRRLINTHKKSSKESAYYISLTDEIMEEIAGIENTYMPTAVMRPMIVEPRDWKSITDGGYLEYPLSVIKAKSPHTRKFLKEQDLSKVLPIINKLQKTPWRINKRVADIVRQVYLGNMIDPKSPEYLPRCYGGLPVPDIVNVEDLLQAMAWKENPTEEEKKAWHVWNKQRERIQIGLDGEKGRRLQLSFTLDMVKEMEKFDNFYYVYQFDYRGRVYPHTDFLNPQAKDYTKAMLEFGEGRLLTKEGLLWLKIHTANTYGLDKEEFGDRVDWFGKYEANIQAIVKNPLKNLDLWVNADSPFEFLASCFAYKDYLEGKLVHLPIQLDAVNSGMQFYSGLMYDKKGALTCCVIGEKRADLYGLVAESTNHKLYYGEYDKFLEYRDSEGILHKVPTNVEAQSLAGNITRSHTKKNVMTVPYSVTLDGMRKQNKDTMNDAELVGKVFWKGEFWIANRILTTAIEESIYEVVEGARLGQKYLKEVASHLKQPAVWHTPLYDFPVMQPAYMKEAEVRVNTPFGKLSIQKKDSEKLHKKKQMSSIAANYIHSIDSTLLLYVVDNTSNNIGVIHDCFLMHPNDASEVRNNYKEGYIEIMDSNPLQKFSRELDPEGKVEVPNIGTLDLNEVRDSVYIIS